MKVQIRQGVFETNSSSTHSLTYVKDEKLEKIINIDDYVSDEDGTIHVSFGEFGWEVKEYYNFTDKLEYLITMAYELQANGKLTKDSFINSDDFKKINEAVLNFTGYNITLDSDIEIRTYKDREGVEHTYNNIDGYIDHQSCEGYENFDNFLHEWGINDLNDLVTFIFSEKSYVQTDNDNY